MGFFFPLNHFNRTFFIIKRLGLVTGILLTVSTGFLESTPSTTASAYYSSFAEVKEVEKRDAVESPLPKRNAVILSEEIIQRVVPTPTPTPVWGKSRQIDEHTWTIDVGRDEHMASAQEIAAALNSYRRQKGVGELVWDQRLAEYAQGRANTFHERGGLDSHAGFQDYIHNQDGFNKLGFYALGENSSIGYHITGTHLIEWVYAGDKPHDDNQLRSDWTHVGVGVNGDATNLIFGGRKQ